MKFFLFSTAAILFVTDPAIAATGFKDFAGQKCQNSQLVKVTKIAEVGFANGPMKGYVNVTVTLPTGDTATAPMPPELVKKIKIGTLACKATFIDEDR